MPEGMTPQRWVRLSQMIEVALVYLGVHVYGCDEEEGDDGE